LSGGARGIGLDRILRIESPEASKVAEGFFSKAHQAGLTLNRRFKNKGNMQITPSENQHDSESEVRKPLWFETTLQDLRFALRTLRKSPGFTATAILTLALGIGANSAVFQLLDAVRLRSLPVPNPVTLAQVHVKGGIQEFGISATNTNLTYSIWEQIRRQQTAFSSIFAWAWPRNTFFLGRRPQQKEIQGLWVTGEMFPSLGLNPAAGRLFTPEDDRPGCGTPGVVISYSLWQSEFGGQDSAIGKSLVIREHPIPVLGVAPAGFLGLEVGKQFDIALPFCSLETLYPGDTSLTRRDYFWLTVMGHLKPGWNLDLASAQLESMSLGLMEETVPAGYGAPALDEYRRFRLAAYSAANGVSGLREKYDASLWLLLGITGLVLLIACANLANLMLARASAREREMAVRLALGATSGRLIRQLLCEGFVLAASGAILGEGLANIFSSSLVRILRTENDTLQLNLSQDWRVLCFTAAVSVLTCIVFGLAPAFRASRAEPITTLKTGGKGMTAGRQRFSLQRLLVISQIAVSLVLLVGALLFVRSFWNLATVNPGFRPNGILLTFINFVRLKIAPERYEIFKRDLLEQIRSIPQVESAAISTHVPLDGSSWSLGVRLGDGENTSKFSWVSPGFFDTMQTPLLAGRDFNDSDTAQSQPVAIVNETFVRKFFAGTNPVGKTFRSNAEPNYPETQYEIIGIVKDTKYAGLREEIPQMAFAPAQQFPEKWFWTYVFVRSSSPPSSVIPAVRERLNQINPEMLMRFDVFETDIKDRLVRERTMAVLSGFFGALAALLSTIGLYGVVSYIIAMRTNEMGIRMALGASSKSVVGIILWQTLWLLALGVSLGVVLTLGATRGTSALLYGLQPNDPLAILCAVALLAGVALIASYVPAHRASRLDPMKALRYE
jgi:predicted permease